MHFHAFLAPNVDFVAEKDKLCVQFDLYWNEEERNFAKDEHTKEVEMKLISSQRHALDLFLSLSIYLSIYL